jgi:membrane-associated phospholipid phosphatase
MIRQRDFLIVVRTMSFDVFFSTITWLGSLYILLPCFAVLLFILLRTGKMFDALLLGLSLPVTVLAVRIAKAIFRRPRPNVSEILIPMPTDWSFPSGHTAQATAFFLVVAFVSVRLLSPLWAGISAAAGILIIIGVGWSRVYLRVHYLSDVVAGWVLAIFIVAAVYVLLPSLLTHFRE